MLEEFTYHLAIKYTPRWDDLSDQEKEMAIQQVAQIFKKDEGKVWLRGA